MKFFLNSEPYFEVLLVSSEKSKVKKIRLQKNVLYLGAVASSVLVFIGFFLFIDYFQMLNDSVESKNLRVENIHLKQKLSTLDQKVAQLDQTLTRIDFLAKKLKVITNSPDPLGNAGAAGKNGLIAKQQMLGVAKVIQASQVVDESHQEGEIYSDQGEKIDSKVDFLLDDLGQDEEGFEQNYSEELANELDQVDAVIQKMDNSTGLVEKNLQDLFKTFDLNRTLLAAIPSMKPTRGYLSGKFGYRISPYTHERAFHNGIDIASPIGMPITSPADGTVIFASTQAGYGNIVIIDHGFGYTTRYGHSSRLFVHLGQRVSRGMKIAEVGNTGRSTGPHLHYEVRKNGIPVNPEMFLGIDL